MSEQLKCRCKFCDSNNLACESFPKIGADGYYSLVWCYDCLAQGPKCYTEAEAIAAWNTGANQMTNQRDNGAAAAFPTDEVMVGSQGISAQHGLTKREYLAAMAIQGVIMAAGAAYASGTTNGPDPKPDAKWAVEFADALLAELSDTVGGE